MKRISCCAVLLLAAGASAAGFAIPEQSARSLGSGGTGTASTSGATALYYNVGKLGFEDGFSAELSATAISPNFQYSPLQAVSGEPASADPALFVVPSVFVSAPLSETLFVGLGAFSNFGLGLRWPAAFAGRFESSASNLTTYTFNAGAGYRLNDTWGLGVGVDVVRGTLSLERQLNLIDSEGSLRVGAGAWGVGANVGLAGRFLHETLDLGLTYRSAVTLAFAGAADFQVPRELEGSLVDQDLRTSLTLPHLLSLGLSYRATSALRMNADLTYSTWSTLDSLALHFAQNPELDQTQRLAWHNTLSARVGAELSATSALTVRLGAGYDPSPAASETLGPSLPDSDRLLFTAGAGYRFGSFTADLGYSLVLLASRESSGDAFPGRYQGTAQLVGLSVGFRQ